MSKEKKHHKTGVLKMDASVIKKMGQDIVKDGIYWNLPVALIPPSFGIPQRLLDKASSVTLASSGSVEEGRDYLLAILDRVDKSDTPGAFVHDAHPILTYTNMYTGTPSPTGSIWEHANFEGRTRPIHPRFTQTSIPDTVATLRSHITQPSSGYIKDNDLVRKAMENHIKVLARQEKALASTPRSRSQPAKPQVPSPMSKLPQAPKPPKATRNRQPRKGRRQ